MTSFCAKCVTKLCCDMTHHERLSHNSKLSQVCPMTFKSISPCHRDFAYHVHSCHDIDLCQVEDNTVVLLDINCYDRSWHGVCHGHDLCHWVEVKHYWNECELIVWICFLCLDTSWSFIPLTSQQISMISIAKTPWMSCCDSNDQVLKWAHYCEPVICLRAGTTIRAAVRDSHNTGHYHELGLYQCRSYIRFILSSCSLFSFF